MNPEKSPKPTAVRWFRAACYSTAYLTVCTVISVLPLARVFDGGPNSTTEMVAILLAAAIFLVGLVLSWVIHRSWRLLVVFLALAYPAFLLAFLMAVVLNMSGLGHL